MTLIKDRIFVKGTKSETVQVSLPITELLETLKREIYRPNDIDFTAFINTEGKINMLEDDYRNNWITKPYKTTPEQKKIIRAFDVVETYLKEILSETP